MNNSEKKLPKLTGSERALLEQIVRLNKIYGVCNKTNKKFAEDYDLKVRTVQRIIKSLANKGCIDINMNEYSNYRTLKPVNYVIDYFSGDTKKRILKTLPLKKN